MPSRRPLGPRSSRQRLRLRARPSITSPADGTSLGTARISTRVASKLFVAVATWLARSTRVVDIDDQVGATNRIFASDRRWTVVRGSDLEEGESRRLPVWSRHVGDLVLASNLSRRVDYALFMVHAIDDESLVREAPAIVGRLTPSALAHASNVGGSGTP